DIVETGRSHCLYFCLFRSHVFLHKHKLRRSCCEYKLLGYSSTNE
ncbi:unnamed protein product, partial [Arabidopsis halleri]